MNFVSDLNSFFANFPAGEIIENRLTNQSCALSISMEFECDENSNWETGEVNTPGTGPKPSSFIGISETSCEVDFYVFFILLLDKVFYLP